MSMDWTKEQMQVITLRDKDLLVSAAAGSGKTAVLVERIIRRILDEKNPVDIDRMLIVTFTSAAAAQMRERIGEAIEDALSKNPSSSHLMRQTTLVHHAQITTVHSFCLYLIRNYFHQVDLEPNFRIAEEGELNLLKEDVMEDVLNRNYERKEDAFLEFAECFATGKKDDGLKEIILKLYSFAMSYPWPKEWLKGVQKSYQFETFSDLKTMPWMESLVTYLQKVFRDLFSMAQENISLASEPDGPCYIKETAKRDAVRIKSLADAGDYHQMALAICAISFDRIPSKRGYDGSMEKLEWLKEQRDVIKDTIKKIKENFFFSDEEEIAGRILKMAPVAFELARLTEEFMDAYEAKKREKNVLDFDDLEHFALKILIDEETKEPTEAAVSCGKMFEEVMIDEYQDSNLVQESLMQAVSGKASGAHNRFMVGDVKQSIYRFRLARPQLFMEKYDSYPSEGADCQKIELHKNFRSRQEVLDVVNHIFYQIMKKDLGNVEYDSSAALYPGALYQKSADMKAEFLIADSADELLEDADLTDPVRLEAELVAARIRKMMRAQQVTDKKTGALRKIKYSDIVILLRSFGKYADTFLEVFEKKNIPVHAASRTGYFQTQEIQTILDFLRILDNPRQDIPLAAVLRSPIFGFLDEELAELKISGENKKFHCCVLEPKKEKLSDKLAQKVQDFLDCLSYYRDLVPVLPVHELLYRILEDTGYARYVSAMPGGVRRKANIEMLLEKAAAYEKTSYRGLFHFIRYMDRLKKYDADYGEADVVSENANVIRIMTIHKSKGLEFPVVFLCGTAKKFNRMDARSNLIIHPDLGAALDYIDPRRRVRSATLYKKAAAKQTGLEDQGEELRILYVALTRAKEKLVITGVAKDIKNRMEKLMKKKRPSGGLSYFIRAGAGSFFDLLLPALIAGGDADLIKIWGVEDLILAETGSQLEEAKGLEELMRRVAEPDEKADAYVSKQLSYQYPNLRETNRRVKYSVSELKRRASEEFLEEPEQAVQIFPEREVIPYIPQFVSGKEKIGRGPARGSAMHRAVECLPIETLVKSGNLKEDLKIQAAQMVGRGQMTEEMQSLLQWEKLMYFYRSKLAMRMEKAAKRNELYKEQPFVMGCRADEVEGDGSDTMILIQGIIDVFFIEDDEIVLLDYKTDVVKSEEELIFRYQKQLDWYQKALEKNLLKKVKEKYIYSFYLDKAIIIA